MRKTEKFVAFTLISYYDEKKGGNAGEEPGMDNRTSKQNYYLDIADSVLERSTCLRRKYGAIIVRNDEIIRLQRRPPGPPQLLGPGLLYAGEPAHPLRRAL